MEVVGLFLFFILVAVIFRICAGSIDGERVERYLWEQGWELLDKSWDPLGPGWFGEKNARIYKIVYRDQDGHTHEAHVKTSMLSGVYLTHDRIVKRAQDSMPASKSFPSHPARDAGMALNRGTPNPATDTSADAKSLAEENQRLRMRIRELENRET